MKSIDEDLRLKIMKPFLLCLLVAGIYGGSLGLKALDLPENTKITDTSFKTYLADAKEQLEYGPDAYTWAILTYSGARIGTAIHNYQVSGN